MIDLVLNRSTKLTRRPYQITPSVAPSLKICHDTVHNVWLGREKVDGVDIWVLLSLVLDLFDIWLLIRRHSSPSLPNPYV